MKTFSPLGVAGPCLLLSLAALTGCSTSFSPAPEKVAATQIEFGDISGQAYGGQNPIANANIYAYAAGTSGYGSASTLLASSTTNSAGFFSFPANTACTSGTVVYLYSLGGNPGGGVNSAAGELAVLGTCPASGLLVNAIVSTGTSAQIFVNEVSTVAAAYALAGYAVNATHIGSSGTTAAVTALQNAGANAAQMYQILADGNGSTKSALATTPNGAGTVPQARLDTIANILAACINSTGPTSAACTSAATTKGLFYYATTTGTAGTGGTPTDTATAAINIAHHPAANPTALYNLIGSTANPFTPALTSAPADLSVTITFTNEYLSAPAGLAVDATGNVWIASSGNSAYVELTPLGGTGAVIQDATYLEGIYGLAIDQENTIWATAPGVDTMADWVPSSGTLNAVTGFPQPNKSLPAIDSLGQYYTGGSGGGDNYLYYFYKAGGDFYNANLGTLAADPYATAVDTNNYAWITSNATGTAAGSANLLKILYNGNFSYATCTGTNYAQGSGVAIDLANDAWVSDYATGYVIKFNNGAGAACSYANSYNGGGLAGSHLVGIAIDGLTNIWTLTSGGVVVGLNNLEGTPTTGAAGLASGLTGTLLGPFVDNAGNLWISDSTANTISEMIGIATPVVTPISVGVANKTLGKTP